MACCSASGTGLQEVACLIARHGGGISHAIGVGGRDLSDAVGGITTLAAIEALDADPTTKRIVLISKPPGGEVASRASAGDAHPVWRFIMEAISVRPTSDGVLWCGGDRTRLFAGFSTKSVTRTSRSLPGLSSGLPPSSRLVPMPNQLVRPEPLPSFPSLPLECALPQLPPLR